MRLLILFLTLLSVAAGFTLQKTDGTTIELGDEPMVIDGSEVIMPQDIFVAASRVKLDGISEAADVSTAGTGNPPAAVHLYQELYRHGRRASAYLCSTGMNGCLADGASEPWASSLTLQETIRSMQCFLDKNDHVAGVDDRSERHSDIETFSDISTADISASEFSATEPFMLALFDQPNYQGDRKVAYSCRVGDHGCRNIRE
ncbi:hypothetical protein J4E91_008087 [Alternaria rosae]|nr:hypothetical protein J4E91_008087 [Alternaria rosae]